MIQTILKKHTKDRQLGNINKKTYNQIYKKT